MQSHLCVFFPSQSRMLTRCGGEKGVMKWVCGVFFRRKRKRRWRWGRCDKLVRKWHVLFCFILVLSASIDAKAQGWKGLPILVLLVWIKGWLDNVLAETELSFYIVHPQPRLVNFYAFQTFFQNKNCRLERDLNTLTIWRQQPPRPQTELSFLYFVNPSTGEKFNFSLDFLAQHFIRIKESSKAVAARWTLYAC